MPIYEYICEKCGAHTEVIQKVSDPPLKRCQTCRGKLEKAVSRTSFQLKGSGWYVTDYSSRGASGDKSDGGSTDAGSASKADTSSSKKESGKPSKAV
jgi:putative FmdB family regulatory protein